MSISVLIALVAGGIAGIVLLLHVMGLSRRMPMSPEDARAAWHREFPDDEATEVMVTPDGLAALILTHEGRGLVWSRGIDPAARYLRDFTVTEDSDGLTIRFSGKPACRIRLEIPAESRDIWRRKLGIR